MKKIPEDIQELDKKIKMLRRREKKKQTAVSSNEYSYAAHTGFRIATELVSGVIVGAAVGWFLDQMLNSSPLLLIVFIMFGGASGFLNVYRLVKEKEKSEE